MGIVISSNYSKVIFKNENEPYRLHCRFITLSHKIELWEESATDEAKSTRKGYEQIRDWSTATRGGGWVAKDDSLCGESVLQ